MKHVIEDDYLEKNNINISIEKMSNSETRYRLQIDDNTLYSITKSGDKLSWQNAHYHKFCNELYIVQKGKVLMVTKDKEKVSSKIIKKDEVMIIPPNVSHNLFMFENAQACVLKYGDIKSEDWNEDKTLDQICKKIKPNN